MDMRTNGRNRGQMNEYVFSFCVRMDPLLRTMLVGTVQRRAGWTALVKRKRRWKEK